MWIFSKLGFYSIVNNNKPRKNGVLIRARCRNHLVALCKLINVPDSKIMKTPENDYRYRIEASYKQLDEAMYHLSALPAGYGNFKGACSEAAARGELDYEYVHTLGDIWRKMYAYQSSQEPGERNNARMF